MFYRLKDKLLRLFAFSAVFALLISPLAINAEGLYSPRVFTRGANIYVVDSGRIVFLSMDTRSSHALYSAPDPVFSIVSAAQTGEMIWASNGAGAVIGVNMQTCTIEEYGRGRVAAGGHLDIDSRYLWLAADDTLFRMDMTSREWVPIPIPESDMDTVRAVMSFNDQVHVVSSSAVYIYRPITGDWVTLPHTTFALGAGDFHRVENVCYFTQGKKIYRYDPSKRLWNSIALRDTIRSLHSTPEGLLAAAENRVYQYSNGAAFVMEPHPTIPMLRGIRSVTRHSDGRTVCALDNGIALYYTPFNFNIAYYKEHLKPAGPDVFAFNYYGHVILYSGIGFIIYNPDRSLWSGVPVVIRNREQTKRYAWDENGAHAYLSEKHKATLGGTASAGVTRESAEPDLLFVDPPSVLNLRAEDLDGRSLDITSDDTYGNDAMRNGGIYYRGNDGDILNRASLGVQGTGMSVGQLTPDILSTGVSAVAGSRTKTGESDRSFLSATAGGGYMLSKTEWRTFSYDPSGVYPLYIDGNRDIAASSVRMYVDGVALPGADYAYDPASRAVRLKRRDKSDPTSVIQISFSLTITHRSTGQSEIESVDHFGQYRFAEGSISPRSWLSARAGVLSMNSDTAGPMILAATSLEWRDNDANRSLLFIPEAAYDSRMGTHAAGVTLGARDNKAFGSYRGYWAARDFSGIDRYNFENRNVGEEHDIDFGYDLRDDLRFGWRQLHREMDFGGHTQFEMYSNYTGDLLPDIEMALSSRITELGNDAADRRRKETMYLRFSDLASSYLTQMSRVHNVGYDFSLTEYSTNSDERGRVVYGLASFSPTSKLTFTGSGVYRANPSGYDEINPTLTVNTHGLPAGVDATAGYSLYVAGQSDNGTLVGVAKNISGYVYPGEYIKSMEKFAFYLEHGDYTESKSFAGTSAARLFFLPDERTYYIQAQDAVGLIFFPTENLLMTTYNVRTSATNSPTQYISLEHAKMWFESGSSVEGSIDVVKHPLLLHLAGSSMYEHCWNENFMTGAGAFGVRRSENGYIDIYGGPQFKATLTKELNYVIKAIENSHYVLVTANKNNVSKPNIEYLLYMRFKILPNISLIGELQAALVELRDRTIAGSLYLHAGF